MPYKIMASGLTDIGLVRQNNEDVWAELSNLGFFALADGMGGHQAGEVAAREAVNCLCKVIEKKVGTPSDELSLKESQDLLRRAISYINTIVYKMAKAQQELRGMGTTLCCLLFHPEGVAFAHVGDSRIYRFRNNHIEQLTKDHSLFRDLVDQGQIDEQQAADFLYKNIITKAIGTEPKVEATISVSTIEENDIYLMCSDGLSDLLTALEIADVLSEIPCVQRAAEALIAKANDKGGKDNITVVIAKIEGANATENLS